MRNWYCRSTIWSPLPCSTCIFVNEANTTRHANSPVLSSNRGNRICWWLSLEHLTAQGCGANAHQISLCYCKFSGFGKGSHCEPRKRSTNAHNRLQFHFVTGRIISLINGWDVPRGQILYICSFNSHIATDRFFQQARKVGDNSNELGQTSNNIQWKSEVWTIWHNLQLPNSRNNELLLTFATNSGPDMEHKYSISLIICG